MVSLDASYDEKYREVLSNTLDIAGSDIDELDREDLQKYGIIRLEDRKHIYAALQNLIVVKKRRDSIITPTDHHNNNNDVEEEAHNDVASGSLSDDEDQDESTVLTDIQWQQLRSDGFCILDDPLKDEVAVYAVCGYLRRNFTAKCMVEPLTRLITTYYHTRYNTDLYVELTCPDQIADSFLVPQQNLRLSGWLQSRLESLCQRIEVTQVPTATMRNVLRYLGHHQGVKPAPLPCPLRSIHMEQIVSDPWDARYVDAMDKKTVFETILAANYLDCQPLLHLGAAKIATLIKQLDQQEINRIIEEEERYRAAQADANQDVNDAPESD